MTKSVLRKYAPLYTSLAVTGLVMTLIFLSPGSALGLTVAIDTPENARNGEAGFTLGEALVIPAQVNLAGEEEQIQSITLDIAQVSGDSGFVAAQVDLPAEVGTFDLSSQLTQGSLSVAVTFNDVTKAYYGYAPDLNFGYGYGYGYIGGSGAGYVGSAGAGSINFAITYTPLGIAGDYSATVTTATPEESVSFTTNFSILAARTGTSTVLDTIYPRTEGGAALAGDLVILQLKVAGTAAEMATDASGTPEVLVTATGNLFTSGASSNMLDASKFHKSLRDKWGVDADADFLAAVTIHPDAVPGTIVPVIQLEDIAGQTDSLNGSVVVAGSRTSFNTYVQPGFNFLSPALECTAGTPACTSSLEYDIEELLKQSVTNGATGYDDLADVVEIIWGYCALDTDASHCPANAADTPSFVSYVPGRSANDLTSLNPGNGYIVKAYAAAFETNECTSPCQLVGDDVPSPIKITFNGLVNSDTDGVVGSEAVYAIWNLVGPQSETDTTVGAYLQAITYPLRDWEQLIALDNLLDVSRDSSGNQSMLANGVPEVVFLSQKFRTLSGPPIEAPGDVIPAGSGLWLRMDADSAGDELPAILSD